MKPYYQDPQVTLYHGDCRQLLPLLPDGLADVVITDPVWPNSSKELRGHRHPYALFAAAAKHFPRLCERVVVQLGCNSDPRFLRAVPRELPFLRACWLEYAVPAYSGKILAGSDLAYAFGRAPRRAKHTVIPGRMTSTDSKRRSGAHPCPRRLQHVVWLVKWFSAGLVLDPFCGSGTTLVGAKLGGWPSVGIEVEERFCEATARRCEQGVFDFSGRSIGGPDQ